MEKVLEDFKHCLCPAGNGVFTVYTARHYREALQQLLYDGIGEQALYVWQERLAQSLTTTKPIILGIASDNGGGILRGANWGPLFVRNALYHSLSIDKVFDLGDVRVIPQFLRDDYLSESVIRSSKNWLYHDENKPLPVSPLSIAEYVTSQLYANNTSVKLFGIGGDHSCSYALVKPYLQHKARHKKRVAIIQFDAHTDIMKARMGVPICFGSWTYHVLDALMDPSLLVQVGIRSSSKTRDFWQRQYGIKQYWAYDILENGADAVAFDLVEYLKFRQVDELYITFDIDALDASIAGATGTPETDGLTLNDAITLLRILAKNFSVTGADLMEVAPFVKQFAQATAEQPKTTLDAAAAISETLLSAMHDVNQT